MQAPKQTYVIARTSWKFIHVNLNAIFPQTSPLNVWLMSWIAIWSRHHLNNCKWYVYCRWNCIRGIIYTEFNKGVNLHLKRLLRILSGILMQTVLKTSWKTTLIQNVLKSWLIQIFQVANNVSFAFLFRSFVVLISGFGGWITRLTSFKNLSYPWALQI